MTELGIGEALEKLIEVLQVEGHELFRIFTDVQAAIGMCNAIIVLFSLLGAIVGFILTHKITKKKGWFSVWEYEDIIFIYLIGTVACCAILLILGTVVTDIYLRINYPEYYAAKELISAFKP